MAILRDGPARVPSFLISDDESCRGSRRPSTDSLAPAERRMDGWMEGGREGGRGTAQIQSHTLIKIKLH